MTNKKIKITAFSFQIFFALAYSLLKMNKLFQIADTLNTQEFFFELFLFFFKLIVCVYLAYLVSHYLLVLFKIYGIKKEKLSLYIVCIFPFIIYVKEKKFQLCFDSWMKSINPVYAELINIASHMNIQEIKDLYKKIEKYMFLSNILMIFIGFILLFFKIDEGLILIGVSLNLITTAAIKDDLFYHENYMRHTRELTDMELIHLLGDQCKLESGDKTKIYEMLFTLKIDYYKKQIAYENEFLIECIIDFFCKENSYFPKDIYIERLNEIMNKDVVGGLMYHVEVIRYFIIYLWLNNDDRYMYYKNFMLSTINYECHNNIMRYPKNYYRWIEELKNNEYDVTKDEAKSLFKKIPCFSQKREILNELLAKKR